MGLTDEEFGRLTLLQFERLNSRVTARLEHDYVCAGIVASTIANVHRDPDKRAEAFSPLDFVPGHKPEAKTPTGLKPLSPEDQVEAFEALFNPKPEIIRR